MEKILRIEESIFKTDSGDYEGYQIITDKQTIKLGISNLPLCCESWGCLITNDDFSDFIGADLINIILVDTALNNTVIEELERIECGDVMFVNFETSNGVLQIVAYNCHNGYYGHEAVLISKQLNYCNCL